MCIRDSTLDIVKAMYASRVPIIVYVWPSGAMAGSAGTFITVSYTHLTLPTIYSV